VTSLSFTPSDRGYFAHLQAPRGWSITSVRDTRGSRVVEHVKEPTSSFDGRLRQGPLVIEVTRSKPDVTGVLLVQFNESAGGTLPGSGSYPLR